MKQALVTGGAGFFGGVLRGELLKAGWECTSLDVLPDAEVRPGLRTITADINDREQMKRILGERKFDAVFHCAALLAHGVKSDKELLATNVDATRLLAEEAQAAGVPSFVFISSNCLWGRPFEHAITEDEKPDPVETYGRSKWEAEKQVQAVCKQMRYAIIRTPTIIEAGRLGLLAILFEFMDENRAVWVVGKGDNRYQFIYAPDLADACIRASQHTQSAVFNVGSDNVKTMREIYEYVIKQANSKSRVRSLPKRLTLFGMKVAYKLGISPLGPYHYRMIASNFVFDTSRLKAATGWKPTLTNEEMLARAYNYYHANRLEIEGRSNASAHRKASSMGIIKLLKWIS